MLNKIYFASLLVLLGFCSCKKQLKEVPFSTLSPSNVFVNEEGLKEATFGAYQSWTAYEFTAPYYRFILSEGASRYVTSGIFGAAYLDPYYSYGEAASDAQLLGDWNRMYQSIARANAVIGNAKKAVADSTIANQYIAEARFLRAYAYFQLVRNYGGVPIIDREITSLADQDLIYGAKATVEQVYNFILQDMQWAEAKLPATRSGSDLGRITSACVKGVLGKVYMTMAGKPLSKAEYYQKAVDKLSEITGAANEATFKLGLITNFPDVYALTNERNMEILFSFGYFLSSSNPYASIWPFFTGPRGLLNGDEQTNFGLTYDFYQLFESSDTRRDFTVVPRYAFVGTASDGAQPGDSIIYDPAQRNYIVKRTGGVFGNSTIHCGLAYGKYARVARPTGANPYGYACDLIELRFSDVLLLLAEGLVETGHPGDAVPLLNRVRLRSHASAYSGAVDASSVRAAVRLERRLELTGELTTVYDIRRWGTLQQEIAATSPSQIINGVVTPYAPKLEIYPTPQAQLDANPNLKQDGLWQ